MHSMGIIVRFKEIEPFDEDVPLNEYWFAYGN